MRLTHPVHASLNGHSGLVSLSSMSGPYQEGSIQHRMAEPSYACFNFDFQPHGQYLGHLIT